MAGFNGESFPIPTFSEGLRSHLGETFVLADDFMEGVRSHLGEIFYKTSGSPPASVIITAPGGSPVADNAVIRVEVTDDLLGLNISIFLEGGGFREAVFNTAAGFGPDYQNVLNQNTSIAGGRRIEFNRDGGWVQASATVRAVATDGDGNISSDSESFTFL